MIPAHSGQLRDPRHVGVGWAICRLCALPQSQSAASVTPCLSRRAGAAADGGAVPGAAHPGGPASRPWAQQLRPADGVGQRALRGGGGADRCVRLCLAVFVCVHVCCVCACRVWVFKFGHTEGKQGGPCVLICNEKCGVLYGMCLHCRALWAIVHFEWMCCFI